MFIVLQEAVDALIENGKGDAAPITASNNRPLKS
jgi:DNA-directed RNA polymerase beta' subunit